jgi:hypothetical protein
MAVRHRGQREPGETTDKPSGMREMQTFRKLPITMPKRKNKKGITALTLPHPCEALNAPKQMPCRMANGKSLLRLPARFEDAACVKLDGVWP